MRLRVGTSLLRANCRQVGIERLHNEDPDENDVYELVRGFAMPSQALLLEFCRITKKEPSYFFPDDDAGVISNPEAGEIFAGCQALGPLLKFMP